MKTNITALLLSAGLSLMGCVSQTSKSGTEQIEITWDNSLVLPPADGTTPNIGVAGAFAGIVNGKLIVAGGANFPDGYPWTGAKKVWHSDAYCMDMSTGQWTVMSGMLQRPLAYGVSIQLPEGILMIGGGNASEIVRSVNLLTETDGKLVIDSISYPKLPVPLTNATGALTGNRIYLAGGVTDINNDRSTHTFLMLDLTQPDKGWQSLPAWPGTPLGFSTSAGMDGKFYLFSGRDFAPGQDLVMHDEGYCFDPASGTWTKLDNSFPFMAGTSFSHDGSILFMGGVEKVLPTTPEHPGFSRAVRRYDVTTNTLDTVSVSPYPIAVTTTTFVVGDTIYVASGEEKPGIRTPHILKGIISSK